MSPASAAPANRALRFFEATIVKKAVMALTGLVLFAFVTGHLLGNLQVFLGPDRLNAYAAFLKSNLEILWGVRTILLVCVVAHIVVTIQLAQLKTPGAPRELREEGQRPFVRRLAHHVLHGPHDRGLRRLSPAASHPGHRASGFFGARRLCQRSLSDFSNGRYRSPTRSRSACSACI